MPDDLDPNVADRLVSSVISRLQPTRGEKVVYTRGALKQAILDVARKAHEIGLLAGVKERLNSVNPLVPLA